MLSLARDLVVDANVKLVRVGGEYGMADEIVNGGAGDTRQRIESDYFLARFGLIRFAGITSPGNSVRGTACAVRRGS